MEPKNFYMTFYIYDDVAYVGVKSQLTEANWCKRKRKRIICLIWPISLRRGSRTI